MNRTQLFPTSSQPVLLTEVRNLQWVIKDTSKAKSGKTVILQ